MWRNADTGNLIAKTCCHLIFCIPCSIFPGRMARWKAMAVTNKMLLLKRSFVRYVSHEIRSALNVSVAGLEMIKSEIEVTDANVGLIDLVYDVSESNETAVEILSDLLQYENIEAGSLLIALACPSSISLARSFTRLWLLLAGSH